MSDKSEPAAGHPAASAKADQTAPHRSAHRTVSGAAYGFPLTEAAPQTAPGPGAGASAPAPQQRRVAPEESRKPAKAQGTDRPAVPGGREPDRAMCEDPDHPGRIDKDRDC